MKSPIVKLEWRYNRKYCKSDKQTKSGWCHNTIVTMVTNGIAIITIVTERDLEFFIL